MVQDLFVTVFQAFVNARFTRRQLYKLCKEKGVDVKGNKEVVIAKVMELYSPEELVEASGILQWLRWHEMLILSILLSGPKTTKEIVEHKLVKRVLSQGVPEAAFGIITPKNLNQREAGGYLSRKVNGLKKKHLLLMKKKGRNGIYSIHPWFLPYLKKKLPPPNEKEITKQIKEEARSAMLFFLKQFPPYVFWATWKDSLERFERLISELREKMEKGESDLRFNVPAVPVSSIAGQYYCEKKVELVQKYGREATQEMMLGREAHEKLLEGAIKIKREKVWRQIAHGLPSMVREMPLLGKYKDVILIGIADGVYFGGGVPKLLFEYKFTKRPRPWRDYHIQARTYCLLLHLMGFDTERLKYALILAPPECRGRKELRGIVKTVLSNLGEGIMEEKVDGIVIKIYVADFEINTAKEDLDWALDFWRKEREAKPTRKAGKCATCVFRKECPDSLAGKA